MEEVKVLEDWMVRYLKHKDIIARKIVSIEPKDDIIIVKEKAGEKIVLLKPELEGFYKDVSDGVQTVIVTFNSEENLKSLIRSWESVKENPQLSIFFVNPLSVVEKRWIVFPRTHARIADEEFLEQGLRAMFDTVEPVTPQVLKRLARQR